MKKAIIFDMDGTLWDSSANVARSWNEKIRLLGLDRAEITQQDIMGVMGLTMDKLAAVIFGDLPEKERMELLDECCGNENAYLRKKGGELYPELEKTLALLGEKYSLCIVSNCQKGYIEAFLDHYSFWKYFCDIECYGNNLKEKGDNIASVIERNGFDKAWYVGDIQGDHDAAVKAGAEFIHAAYGFGNIREKVPELAEFRLLPELMEKLD